VFGGHIEPGEQPEQALIRELQEELDITSTHWIELETISETISERDGMQSQDLVARFYLITNWVGTPINHQAEEHSVIQWFSYDEAIRLKLAHPAYPRLFAECLQWIADNKQ
jgi:8-oxo-dGTP pyrophosphatase MutT (NUDIX family)